MSLTTQQKTTLKTYINSIPALASLPPGSDSGFVIAAALKLYPTPDFFVWGTAQPTSAIFDALTWQNFTPVDAVPTDTVLNNAIWQSRALQCQGKQFNIQTMLMGQQTINGAKANVRAGLQDALTGILSGASGAPLAGNWPAVRTALARKANVLEKLFADTSGGQTGATAQLAATMVIEGELQPSDVEDARVNG